MYQSNSNSINENISDWLDEQRQQWGQDASLKEQTIMDLFHFLACAFGPLNREDLSLLMEGAQKNVLSLDAALDIIQPFIMGDGVTEGYLFNDPQVGEHFYNRLKEDGRLKLEARFLNWGHQILGDLEAGNLTPEAAPAYAVQYYAAHLERIGGREEDLFVLVSNSWCRAWKALEGGYSGFLGDIERAWRAAVGKDRSELEQDRPAPHLGMEVRCGLCKSSVVSLATDIPPALLGALVEKKIWTPVQGLAYALRAPEDQRQLDILAPLLSEELLEQALKTTLTIEDWQIQAHYLLELFPYLSGTLQQEALGVVKASLGSWASWGKLEEMASLLPEKLLQDVLVATQGLADWKVRTDALVALIPHLSEKQLVEALVLARELENIGGRGFALARMISHLKAEDHPGVIAEALEAAKSTEDKQYHLLILTEVIPYLPEEDRDQYLLEGLEAASEIEDEVFRAIGIEGLFPFITEPLAIRILDIVRELKASWLKAYVLDKLAPYLPNSILYGAMRIVNEIEDPTYKADALASLAPQMSGTMIKEALKGAFLIDKQSGTAQASAKLIPHLPNHLLQDALEGAKQLDEQHVKENTLAVIALRLTEMGEHLEAFKLLKNIEGTWAWVTALATIAPHLSEAHVQDMLSIARTIEDNWRHVEALSQLAPFAPEKERVQILEEILEALQTSDSKWERGHVLPDLIPYLSKELLQKAAMVAQEINDEEEQMETLITLALHLVKSEEVSDGLVIIDAIEDSVGHAVGLVEIIADLPEAERNDVLTVAIDEVKALELSLAQVHMATELAQWLPEPKQESLLQWALSAVLAMEDGYDKELAFARIVSLLPASLLRKVLDEPVLTEMGSSVSISISKRLGELGFPEEAFVLAKEISDEVSRADAICGLAPHLSDALLKEALRIVKEITDDRTRAIGLAVLSNGLPGDEGLDVFFETFEIVQSIEDETRQSDALCELIQYLPEAGLNRALAFINKMEQIIWKEIVLQNVVSRLYELGCHEDALRIAQMIESDWQRVRLLAKLAPYLSEELLVDTARSTKDITNSRVRQDSLSDLAPELAKLSRLQLYDVWQEIFPILATYPRDELLGDLCALMQVITKLGGPKALSEIAQAIREVGMWWS